MSNPRIRKYIIKLVLHNKEHAMRLVSVHNLNSNMKLAKSIYHHDTLVLKEGCSSLNRFTKQLLKLGINYIYVTDGYSDDIEITDVVKANTRQACKMTLQKVVGNFISSNSLDVNTLTDSITSLLDEIFDNKDVMINLREIGSTDDSTYIHSISTTIYALMLAINLGYDHDMLKKLAMGTLLHDIGKLLLDRKIIFKKGRLTDAEFEYIKSHTTRGYEALKNCSGITELSRIIALYHHEKLDGTGYPTGTPSSELHPFIRIVTIADVYDALTSDRCYRKRWTAKQAYDHLLEFSGTCYDTEFVRLFLQNISIYPNGSIVKLSNHYYGIVKEQNKNMTERPIVRVIADPTCKQIRAYEIDLKNALDITIIESELNISVHI